MTLATESSIVSQIAETAEKLGYKVTREPSRPPAQKFWPDGLVSRLRGSSFKPDLLVENGGQAVAVEFSLYPVLLYGMMKTSERLKTEHTQALLCLLDHWYPRIPGSVREYADDLGVRLCPLSTVGEALREMLE